MDTATMVDVGILLAIAFLNAFVFTRIAKLFFRRRYDGYKTANYTFAVVNGLYLLIFFVTGNIIMVVFIASAFLLLLYDLQKAKKHDREERRQEQAVS
ncbi:hypothetical protein [Alkalicoccus chagannorensis]|uniref:hypothetical protein n=1 Tax=Alkalicoccus chagannorensis TaxID=427072 RepID=UPI00041BBD02|nr:hypothetical protein [Alkalicoccus chagannorensis]